MRLRNAADESEFPRIGVEIRDGCRIRCAERAGFEPAWTPVGVRPCELCSWVPVKPLRAPLLVGTVVLCLRRGQDSNLRGLPWGSDLVSCAPGSPLSRSGHLSWWARWCCACGEGRIRTCVDSRGGPTL